MDRLIATDDAIDLLKEIIAENEGVELIFHQANGCCEGTKPSLYKKKHFRLRKNDVKIGQLEGVKFWVDRDFYQYWANTQFLIRLVEGIGPGGFSMEVPKGKSFITEHTLLDEDQLKLLDEVEYNI